VDQKGVAHILVLIILLVGVAIGVYLSQNPQFFKPKADKPTEDSQKVTELTAKVVQDNDLEAAKQRKEILLNDPSLLFTSAISKTTRDSLSDEVKQYLEEEVELEGTVLAIYLDGLEHKDTKLDYKIEDQNKKLYNLRFVKDPQQFPANTKLRIKALKIGSELIVESPKEATPRTHVQVVAEATVAPLAVSGNRRALVLGVNFSNDTTQPIDTTQLDSIMFTSTDGVNSYYKENSYQLVSFSGDVNGYLTIPYTNSSCESNYYNWSNAADSQAASNGITLSNYSHIVYVFPIPPGCVYGGLGTTGGSPGRVWMFNYHSDRRGYAHELGHNLGIAHANSLSCGAKAIDRAQNCTQTEYGDVFDVMGNFWYVTPNLLHFNAPHKAALGWIPASKVQNLAKKGTYRIYHSETLGAGTQVLKINKPDTGESYYISYRQNVGFDLGLTSTITRGANIHVWNGNPATQTKLIDATPGTGDFSGFADSSLYDGAVFNDSVNRIRITQKSHTSSYVDIDVR
jgi:hypothetical protein